jgi:hypothetical protein
MARWPSWRTTLTGGYYPKAVLQRLGALGGLSAHIGQPDRPADYGLAIRRRNLPRAAPPASWSGATTCGVYMEQSGNRT